jgi:hypothetical protein
MQKECAHPKKMSATGECSAEQKQICHGAAECENPQLRPADGQCTAERIEKCHGKGKNHPCS